MSNNFYGDNNQVPQGGSLPPYPPKTEMSIKDWLITLIVLAIPCVGIVMLFVWAFSNNNPTKSNFCKAYLIFIAICFVLGIILTFIFGAAIAAMFNPYYYY